MDFRYLGNSGLKISEIAQGNWLTHGSQVENDNATQCVHAALDAGITSFDTADHHPISPSSDWPDLEPLRDHRDVVQATRHVDHQDEQLVLGGAGAAAIRQQENQGTAQSQALVSVDQRLVLAYGMHQGCCLLGQRGVGVLAEHRRLRAGDSPFKQTSVPDDASGTGNPL